MTRAKASELFASLVQSLPRPHGSVAIARLDDAGHVVPPSRLSRWQDPNHEDPVPLYAVLALQMQSGSTLVSDAMSAMVEREDICASAEVLATRANLLGAELSARLAEAKDPSSPGGKALTPAEKRDILQHCDRAVEALMAFRNKVEGGN